MKSLTRSRKLAAVTVLALAASLTACAAEDEASGGNVAISIPVGVSIAYAPWDVAADQGYFADEGLDVTLRSFDSGVDGTNAMLAGQVQVGGTVEIAMVSFLDQGADLVVPAIWYTGQEARILVPSSVKKPSDLEGMTIGVQQGGVYDYGFTRWLEANGVPDDSVTRVNVAGAEQVAALAKGDIDGIVNQEPIIGRALEELGDSVDFLTPGLEQVYTARNWMQFERSYAEANPEVVEGILAALQRANEFLKSDPEAAAAIVAARLGISADDIPRQWEEAGASWDVYLDEEASASYQGVADWMLANDRISSEHPESDFVDDSYLTAVNNR
ncbi:MAG: ABC transporter substrate-binding protein [Salinibacterium amurskyense]